MNISAHQSKFFIWRRFASFAPGFVSSRHEVQKTYAFYCQGARNHTNVGITPETVTKFFSKGKDRIPRSATLYPGVPVHFVTVTLAWFRAPIKGLGFLYFVSWTDEAGSKPGETPSNKKFRLVSWDVFRWTMPQSGSLKEHNFNYILPNTLITLQPQW